MKLPPLSAIDAELERRKIVPALRAIYRPARYKVLYGGRGGAKSWGVARALLMMGAGYQLRDDGGFDRVKNPPPLRVMCTRETMESLAGSVHQLLSDQIAALGLAEFYDILKSEITGRNGTKFIFKGLSDPDALKSAEGMDVVWVEEAHNVMRGSWAKLIPTVRKSGSEIWITFNPELENDDTYRRFVLSDPASDLIRVKINYTDNPYLPEILRLEASHCLATAPGDYAHIWLGEPRGAVSGAVYGREIAETEAAGRIASVPWDRAKPVETYWDLGFGDHTAVWFAQTAGGWIHIIDYMEGRGLTITDYMLMLSQRGYVYGTCHLPHDALDTIIHGKLSSGDKSRSIEMIMRAGGYRVSMVPKMHVHTGINAARTLFPLCRFDREKTADGLQWLRRYQWGERKEGNALPVKPKHDEASHAADAFRMLALSAKTEQREQAKRGEVRRLRVVSAWG